MSAARFSLVAALVPAIFMVTPAQAATPAQPFDESASLAAESLKHDDVTAPYSFFRSVTAADLFTSMVSGADYLQAMQADITEDNAGNGLDGAGESPDDPDDGGWDWVLTTPPDPVSHSTGASPKNLYGVSALGLYYAYLMTSDAGYLTAMKDAADAAVADAGIRSASDLVFLQLYDDLPSVSGTTYADAAKTKYDGRIATYGSADSLAKYIRDVRAGQGYENGIIPWDVGTFALAAAMLDDRYGGYASDADDIAEVLWQDSFNSSPGYFDVVADAGYDSTYANTDYWWYNLGISGLLTAFVASDTHTSEIPGLVTRITDSQFPSGAISFSYGANPNDEDWQSSAYCAMALARNDHTGYTAEIRSIGDWICSTADTLTGGWRYSSGSHYPEIVGENVCGLYFAYLGANSIAPVDPGSCISIVDSCVTVAVDITRDELTGMRGFSVDVTLTGLDPCNGTASFVEGTYLSSFPGIIGTAYQVVDNGGGSYTVDCAILGSPCGQTAAGGTLFTIDVKSSGVDGTGTVAVSSVETRDCSNVSLPALPGADLDLTIDTVVPAAAGDLAAAQVTSGNGTDGITEITLTFTAPGDAAAVEVWRKGYGDYPEYDDGTGAVPTAPTDPADALANGWTMTAVTASGQTDEPSTRDFWYYAMFSEDACGNVSPVSNLTSGTLNYHLGDVSDGITPGLGDNDVGIADISLLGSNYGITGLPYGDAVNYLDVGPTGDGYVNTRPLTDNAIDFEDLILFAINYGQVSRPAAPTTDVEWTRPQLVLVPAGETGHGTLVARLMLRNHGRNVKGIHSLVSYDAAGLRLVGVTQGELLDGQSAPVFFKHLETAEGAVVDAAVLGRDLVLSGSGEVAVLEFERTAEGGRPELARADLRDGNNRPADEPPVVADQPAAQEPAVAAAPAAPARLELVGARPNPFGSATRIVFRLPAPTRVNVNVYDVEGRLVRTLVDRTLAAGEQSVSWDGRANDGSRAGAGIFFYSFRAGDLQETRKLVHLR